MASHTNGAGHHAVEVPAAKVVADSPLDAPLPTRRMVVNMGPSHPATHGVTKMVVELDGETVTDCKIEIGFLHRGFEKSCENSTWTQVFPYTDRLNYVSSIMNNVGYALAVEKLCKLDIPDRAKYLRVVSAELHRICDHMTVIGATGLELGAMTIVIFAVEARDLLWDRLTELCGARLTSNYAASAASRGTCPRAGRRRRSRRSIASQRSRDEIDDAAQPQPDLLRPHSRRRRHLARGRHRLRVHRPVPARVRRALRRPQGVALPRLRPPRLRRPGGHERRQLRPLPHAHRGGQPVRPDRPPVPPSRWSPARSSCEDFRFALPPKPLVYGTIEGVMAHFKHHHGGDQGPRRRGVLLHRGRQRRAGLLRSSPTAAAARTSSALRAPVWPMLMALPRHGEGPALADLIPTFDSINMIAGEVEQ